MNIFRYNMCKDGDFYGKTKRIEIRKRLYL